MHKAAVDNGLDNVLGQEERMTVYYKEKVGIFNL